MYLGIDYGLKNIGLALSQGEIASPFKVLRIKDPSQAIQKIQKTCRTKKIKKIIIGLSEDETAQRTEKFAHLLCKKTSLPVIFVDETLTTQEVQQKMVQAKTPLGKRKTLSHAFAAALILQRHLDNNSRQIKKNMAR